MSFEKQILPIHKQEASLSVLVFAAARTRPCNWGNTIVIHDDLVGAAKALKQSVDGDILYTAAPQLCINSRHKASSMNIG